MVDEKIDKDSVSEDLEVKEEATLAEAPVDEEIPASDEFIDIKDLSSNEVHESPVEEVVIEDDKVDLEASEEDEDTIEENSEQLIVPSVEEEEAAMETPVEETEEALEEDKKPDSTLNNEPIEDTGPKKEFNIEADDSAFGKVADDTSPLATVMTRNKFYQDGYKILQKAVLWEAMAIGGLIIAFLVLLAFSKPNDRFFATTSDGRLIKLAALSEPLLQKTAVISFASQAATEVMTFGFHDYRSRLQTASENFTQNGWDSFLKALGDAQYIDTLTNNRQVISAIPLSPPVIVAEGLSQGIYKWSIEVPLSLSIESGSQIASKKILVKMVVARRSRVENDKGLGIDQWVTATYRGK